MSRLIDVIEQISLAVAVFCVVLVMFIVSYDAFARYALGGPLPWAFDVVSHFLLLGSVFFAASATFQAGDQINIDLFRPAIPAVIRARIDGIWCLLAAGAFGIMAYGAVKESFKLYDRGAFLTGYILWPAWVPYALIGVGCAVLTLRLLISGLPMIVTGQSTLAEHHIEELGE